VSLQKISHVRRSVVKKLVIYGLSNPVIISLIEAINRDDKTYDLQGFIKAPSNPPASEVLGYPVLGTEEIIPELLKEDKNCCFFPNLNYSPVEMREADRLLESFGCQTVSLIHPAIDMKYVEYGKSIMLCEGAIVGPGVTIGNRLVCRLGSTISHEVKIEDYVYIGPGATICGEAHLKEGCYIGAGATVLPDMIIGRNTIVGAGAVVNKNLPDNVTAVGVPARIIKTFERDEQKLRLFPKH
jgi:sugar O-acyltransferase (sialic acid O-acetyltransferase NeuD family)